MTKKEFIAALGKGLAGLSHEEQDKWLDFYSEMIDDRMEENLNEEEAVAAVGAVEEIAEQILGQAQPEQPPKAEKRKTWQTVLLIAGAPVWLGLLIAAAAIVLAAVISLWSGIIALYAAAVGLMACGLGGVVALPVFIHNGNTEAGLFCIGVGFFCAGVGIAMFVGVNYLAKGTVWLCKKAFRHCIPGKEAAA